jgi:ectoine hydroxylase
MTDTARTIAAPTAAEREQFDRNGFLVIRGALTPDETSFYRKALDRAYRTAQAGGRIAPGEPMHQLNAVAHCPEAVGLVDHRVLRRRPRPSGRGGAGMAADHGILISLY